jgi:drug/metabolite transporter (DMT)-like permease
VADAGERREGPDRITLVAFGLFVTLAGGNVIAVRYISCEACELDPFWAAATRFLIASAIFAVIALALRTGMPRGRALIGAVIYGVLGFGAAFAFAYWGLQRVSGGLGAILLATVPLLTFRVRARAPAGTVPVGRADGRDPRDRRDGRDLP